MSKQLVFVCIASNFQWGKGKTQIEAMRNARVQFKDEYSITVIATSQPTEVQVSGMGGIYSSNGDDVYHITEKPEKLWEVFNEETWDEFINSRILPLAEVEIRDRREKDNDIHGRLADKIDEYIDKVVLQYD